MRKQKRDRSTTLFNRGFNAGLTGKSREECPVQTTDLRSCWMSGWREGREAHWNGMSGVSAIQVNPALG
ncbi:ribosome modulation factor [Nitrincola tapanii]|uniref:Ribosome modulation factor n=1 Tax=Nitrincola tapanii TaxID=1708751 RepID=A0A5A9W5N9_9GAMM|nr:ribosome modulation factor [Nitrincola tapanii]KAA0875764.1 ribosome modulation factor [Nitrincola tapanii]